MKKLLVDIGLDYNFLLLGIVSQEKPHRLVWLINRQLGSSFKHDDELQLYNNETPTASFLKYQFADEMNHLDLTLIENKDQINYLIPELRAVDYFLMIKGALNFLDVRYFINSLKPTESVQLITEIDHQKLKSKQNLIF